MKSGEMIKKSKGFFCVVLTIMFLILSSENCRSQTYEEVIPEEAHYIIQEQKDNADFVILDVRTPEEFARERIEGSVNIDIRAENFREEVEGLSREKIYLIYCRTASRSERAFTIFKELGFREVYHMLWGIKGWKEAGLPVVGDQ
jgi:rhodanese-related sulfurtransferase